MLVGPTVAWADFVARVLMVHDGDRLTIYPTIKGEGTWFIFAMWIVQVQSMTKKLG